MKGIKDGFCNDSTAEWLVEVGRSFKAGLRLHGPNKIQMVRKEHEESVQKNGRLGNVPPARVDRVTKTNDYR